MCKIVTVNFKMRTPSENRASRCVTFKFRKILLSVIVFNTIYLLITLNYSSDLFFNKNELQVSSMYMYSEHDDYAIKTQGCNIPAMAPFNKLIEEYVHYPKNLKPCPNSSYVLLEQNGTHIWLVNDTRVLLHYRIKNRKKILCCYSSFFRPDYIQNIYDEKQVDERIQYNECIYFKDIIAVYHEFVRVQCFYGRKLLHDQFFIFVPFKNLTYNDNEKKPAAKDSEKTAFNVLIIGIDNLSRLNFHRTMPQTAEFMKNTGAIELMGYNKVGDNSFPNLVPLLMGYAMEEIKEICHPMPMTTFDDCPFLWHWYKDAGYYTAFGEDSGFLGTFNYMMKGFRKTPTDYYLHPFISEAERQAGNNQDFNAYLCMNEHYFYQILLDYIQTITETLWDSKLFGFFWETTMTHDYLNYPMAVDKSYLRFFKALEKSDYLKRTIIFFISDHGIRWGDFRRTKQGYLEERLPLAYILMPPSFSEIYTEAYNNLKYNSLQLTTPFDMHETLRDLINLENIQNESILERSREMNMEDRGISLFLKVPQNRTYKSAGIADHWCACHRRVEISNTSEVIASATEYLITYLNIMLTEYPQCAKLELDVIQESVEMMSDDTEDLQGNWKEYSVIVHVKPSGGVFEATLRDDGNNWTVIGGVSRLNLYGDQSLCVNDPQIKLYCYCIQNDVESAKPPEPLTTS